MGKFVVGQRVVVLKGGDFRNGYTGTIGGSHQSEALVYFEPYGSGWYSNSNLALAPVQPVTSADALPSDGDVPVLPGSPLDQRLLASADAGGADASEYDMYKVEASRQQLLEDFYQLMVGIDVIGDIKEDLMNEGEMEAWSELAVLEGALRTRKPANGMTAHELYTQADARAAALEARVRELEAALERIANHSMDDFKGVEQSRQGEMFKMEFGMIQTYAKNILAKADRKGGA